MPAGSNSASFDFSVVDDDVVNLTRDITVTATASGIAAQPATVTIYDDEAPTLSVTLPAQVSEGAHTSVDNATVTLSHAGTAPLTVALSASPASQLSVQPTSVTVPAGQTQASFKVDAVDDNAIDGNVAASVIASAPGIQTGSAQTLTMDNDPRALGLSLPATIQEDKMASATVTIAGTFSAAVVVHLSSSDPAVASIPATVTVPAGALSNTFAITPTDNAVRDG